MKKLISGTILAAMLVFSFSCRKDNAENTATNFSAKVEGTLWTATNMAAGHESLNNVTQIMGMGATAAEQVYLEFKGSGTGTYKLNVDNLGMVSIGTYSFTSFMSAVPVGEIVITKYDEGNKKISGTFHFQGEDIDGFVYNVTEGKFDNITLVIQ